MLLVSGLWLDAMVALLHTRTLRLNLACGLAYAIHTNAVKDALIPKTLPWKVNYKYANEADLINLALFGSNPVT